MPGFYRVFDLLLQSELECPELMPAESTGPADCVIRYGSVPAELERPVTRAAHWQTAPGHYLNHLQGFADFHVHDGREIVIDTRPGVPEATIRLFLLGACLSILMHQRRLFVLHASGIATERGAVLFAGKSGSGKSTMVSALLDRGYKIVADDMLVLRPDDAAGFTALPGFPQVKLKPDAARVLGRSIEGLREVMPGGEKFIAPERERFSAAPAPLHAIYDLQVAEGSAASLQPLAHTPRFNILLDHTWQKATLLGLGVLEWHFQMAARVAALTYAARLTRTPEPLHIARTVDLVEADMLQEHPLA